MAIFPSSTISRIAGISSVRRIYRRICSRLSPTACPNSSFARNFDPSGVEVKSDLLPCLFIASSLILYAKAFSLGRIVVLWRLLSHIMMTAVSLSRSTTSPLIVLYPRSSQALFLLCPEIISKVPPGIFLTVTGVSTPFSRMLSIRSIMSSSSLTLYG